MTTHALLLAKFAWDATDSPARRRFLTAARRASYGYTALSLVAVISAVAS